MSSNILAAVLLILKTTYSSDFQDDEKPKAFDDASVNITDNYFFLYKKTINYNCDKANIMEQYTMPNMYRVINF